MTDPLTVSPMDHCTPWLFCADWMARAANASARLSSTRCGPGSHQPRSCGCRATPASVSARSHARPAPNRPEWSHFVPAQNGMGTGCTAAVCGVEVNVIIDITGLGCWRRVHPRKRSARSGANTRDRRFGDKRLIYERQVPHAAIDANRTPPIALRPTYGIQEPRAAARGTARPVGTPADRSGRPAWSRGGRPAGRATSRSGGGWSAVPGGRRGRAPPDR